MASNETQSDGATSTRSDSILPEGKKTAWIRIFSVVTIVSGLSSGVSLFTLSVLLGVIVMAGVTWAGVSLWQSADGFNKAASSGDWSDANHAVKKLKAHFKILGLTGIVTFIVGFGFAMKLLTNVAPITEEDLQKHRLKQLSEQQ